MAYEKELKTGQEGYAVTAIIPSTNLAQILLVDGEVPCELHLEGNGARTYEHTLMAIGKRLTGRAVSVDTAFYDSQGVYYLTKAVDPRNIAETGQNVSWAGPDLGRTTPDNLQQYWRLSISDLLEQQREIRDIAS